MQEQAHKLGNYVVTSNNGKLTINPAPLTVTAADANRLYGDPNPAFTGTITGIKNADNITATYASAATAASPVGTYAIVPTLVDPDHKLGNYVVTSNDGKLTVNPAPGDGCGCWPAVWRSQPGFHRNDHGHQEQR